MKIVVVHVVWQVRFWSPWFVQFSHLRQILYKFSAENSHDFNPLLHSECKVQPPVLVGHSVFEVILESQNPHPNAIYRSSKRHSLIRTRFIGILDILIVLFFVGLAFIYAFLADRAFQYMDSSRHQGAPRRRIRSQNASSSATFGECFEAFRRGSDKCCRSIRLAERLMMKPPELGWP